MGVFVFRGALQVITAVSGIMRPGTQRNDRLRPISDSVQRERTSIPTGGRRYENCVVGRRGSATLSAERFAVFRYTIHTHGSNVAHYRATTCRFMKRHKAS